MFSGHLEAVVNSKLQVIFKLHTTPNTDTEHTFPFNFVFQSCLQVLEGRATLFVDTLQNLETFGLNQMHAVQQYIPSLLACCGSKTSVTVDDLKFCLSSENNTDEAHIDSSNEGMTPSENTKKLGKRE